MPREVNLTTIPQAVRDAGLKVFNEEIFSRWLVGSEPLLGGRRPIDVVRAGEISAVVDALIAIGSGGHA